MEWTPQNLIALAAVGVALLSALSSAAVAVTATRRQQKGEAANRRRDAHLRFWQAANAALHLMQGRTASTGDALDAVDLDEVPELGATLRDARTIYYELEVVSPAIADPSLKVLTGLELAHLEVKNLEVARRQFSGGNRGFGGQIHTSRLAALGEVRNVAELLNDLQRHLARHDRSGKEPRPSWPWRRRKR